MGAPQYKHPMVFGTMWLQFLHLVRASCISSVAGAGSVMSMYSCAILITLLYCETGFKVNAVPRGMEMSETGYVGIVK